MKMKRVFFIGFGSLGLFVGIAGMCGWSGARAFRRIMNNELRVMNGDFKLFKWCISGVPVIGDIENLINGKTYYVLLQNNYELRATGGFMGSYAKISTERGIKEIKIQDIYVPDGQIAGHVEPPYPIQEAFRIGNWWLRDSNWDPDFASAAATVAWFLDQGGEPSADGVVAVNQLVVLQLLKVLGPIEVKDYGKTVTEQNFYSLAQTNAEWGWFPGSSGKRDFLGAVSKEMIEKVKKINLIGLINLIDLMNEQLRRKQVLVWMRDGQLETAIGRLGWGGRLEDEWDKNSDYMYIVESNLGANKANCCVTRLIDQEVSGGDEKVKVTWKKGGAYRHPLPPGFLGGGYRNYVRVVIPSSHNVKAVKMGDRVLRKAGPEDFATANSLRQSMTDDMYVVEPRGELQIIGFWVIVSVGEKVRAEIEYKSVRAGEYKILVKRQPGIEGFDYRLTVDDKVKVDEFVDQDIWIK